MMVVRLPVLADVSRPRTRGDCMRMSRPCAFIACRHHLADVHIYTDGSITIGELILAPDATKRELDTFADNLAETLGEMRDTCVLDVIDRTRADELTLEQIGRRLGVTRERIRQIERKAVARMGRETRRALVDAVDDIDRTRADARRGGQLPVPISLLTSCHTTYDNGSHVKRNQHPGHSLVRSHSRGAQGGNRACRRA